MNQETRNKLQRATQQVRRILEEEFAEQLEGTFDILPDGKILPEPGKHLDARQRLTRQKLVDVIEHIKAGGRKPHEAVDEYTREAAFTFLNRFVALRMLEARDLLQECVSKGDQSSGFKEFYGLAPGLASLPDDGYRLYLECLFDELSVEVKVLFDRRDPANLLWPRRGALTGVLEIVGQADLARIWSEDETIGWVYQYFNSDEDRKKARYDEEGNSKAPQNSYELAVRNQFFTPRYVVEFLTDNTLGRIWYEMRKGETRLLDECCYLVNRPSEVFLTEGQDPPTGVSQAEKHQDVSHEELLNRTVYIPHRSKKDPRDLKILDPACGSGHFLLYAFDLLIAIYEESWNDEASPESEVTGMRLRDDYGGLEQLHAALPGLVLRHNLYGIDIDPRAAQIAALALWMRGQRVFNDAGIGRAERATVAKSNIVSAEPMPGETRLLDEFIRQQCSDHAERRVLGQLVSNVFEEMALAGEAGSLLQIETHISSIITDAHRQWASRPRQVQRALFEFEDTEPVQNARDFDVSGITDETFWSYCEKEIYDALREYSEHAADHDSFSKQLFSQDASRGFAFVDECTQRYDTVLMNPPFGAPATPTLTFMGDNYEECKEDIDAAMVSRGLQLLRPNGKLGAIVNRTQFSKSTLEQWREECLIGDWCISECADFGLGVLDGALVETAAYTLSAGHNIRPSVFFRLSSSLDRGTDLCASISAIVGEDDATRECPSVVMPRSFSNLPASRIAYWLTPSLRETYNTQLGFEGNFGAARQGTITSDNPRFLRLIWEIPHGSIGSSSADSFNGHEWFLFAKGGEWR